MWLHVAAIFIVCNGLAVNGYERGLVCETDHGKGVWHTDSGTRTAFRCCTNLVCPKGTQPKTPSPCTNLTHDTLCVECPKGWYQDTEQDSQHNILCQEKTCPRDQNLMNPDDRTTAPICKCNLDKGYYNVSIKEEICDRRHCGIGLELDEIGVCLPCKNGFFKDKTGYDQCKGVSEYCAGLGKRPPSHLDGTKANCIDADGSVEIPTPKTTPELSSSFVTERMSTVSSTLSHLSDNHHRGRVNHLMILGYCTLAGVLIIVLLSLCGLCKYGGARLRRKLSEIKDKGKKSIDCFSVESGSLSMSGTDGKRVSNYSNNKNRAAVEHGSNEGRQNEDKTEEESHGLLAKEEERLAPIHRRVASPCEGSDDVHDEDNDSVPELQIIATVTQKRQQQQYNREDSGIGSIDNDEAGVPLVVHVTGGADESKNDESPPEESPTDDPPPYTSIDPDPRRNTSSGTTPNTSTPSTPETYIVTNYTNCFIVKDVQGNVHAVQGAHSDSLAPVHNPSLNSDNDLRHRYMTTSPDSAISSLDDETAMKQYPPAQESHIPGTATELKVVNPGVESSVIGMKCS